MARVGQPLDDLTIKKIVADYVETNNYSETARRFCIDRETVKKYVEINPDFHKLSQQKKEQNKKQVLDSMEKLTAKKNKILKLSLSEMERLLKEHKVSANSLATIYGVIMDKELKVKELDLKEKELINKNKDDSEAINQAKEIIVSIRKTVENDS